MVISPCFCGSSVFGSEVWATRSTAPVAPEALPHADSRPGRASAGSARPPSRRASRRDSRERATVHHLSSANETPFRHMERDCAKLGRVNNAVNTSPGSSRGAVEKALEVLATLAGPGGPHRLADLAQACDLPKPTAHRMLQTFTEAGYAVGAGSGRYAVGPRLLGLSAAALTSTRPLRPVLADLQRRSGHTVHYAVRHADRAVYVEKLEPDQAYRLNPGPAARCRCTAPPWAARSCRACPKPTSPGSSPRRSPRARPRPSPTRPRSGRN